MCRVSQAKFLLDKYIAGLCFNRTAFPVQKSGLKSSAFRSKSFPQISSESYRHNAVSNRFSSHLSTSPTNAATFVSRGCGGYTLGFAQRIAHNGTHGETGGLPSLVHSVVLCCRRYPFYSTTLLYTYISRFSVNPHHQAEGETQAKLPSLTLSPTVSHRVFQLLPQMAHVRFHRRKRVHTPP